MFNFLRYWPNVPKWNIPTSKCKNAKYSIYILVNTEYVRFLKSLVLLVSMNYDLVVLFWISLITNDVEYLFCELIGHLWSSIVKCLLKSFTHLKILSVYLLLIFRHSLHILDMELFVVTCITNIFTQSVACLFIFLLSW